MEVYGRCDPGLHEDPGQEDRGATDCPGPLYTGNGASWSPRRPAGQQRAVLGSDTDGTRSRGLIIPSRRMFSTAPAGGLVPLVSSRDVGVHISSPVSSMCLRAKGLCAPQEDLSGSAAAWRSPKSGDQEDDGRPSYPKRSRRPRARS